MESYTYQHDGGPFQSHLTIEEEEYRDGEYRLSCSISDVTDYHRILDYLRAIGKQR